MLTSRRATGGTRPALDYSALRSIPIVEGLPIMGVVRKAHAKKKAKECEAARILGEVNDYLLGELGIKIPPEKSDNTRFFRRQMRTVSGGRLDAEYHHARHIKMERAVEKCAYETRPIGGCVRRVSKGFEVGAKNYVDEGIPYVRVSNLDAWGIHPENCGRHVSKEMFAELRGSFMPRAGEVVYTKDGTIGSVAFVEKDVDCIISGGILRISPTEDVDARYLATILSSPPIISLANRAGTGGVLRHLLVDDFLRIRIPAPPLKKQREIAGHIRKIRARAKSLLDGAGAIMKAANDEVERIILAG